MSGTATLGLTEAQTLTALRGFLIGALPAGIEVIRAEINRVPEPQAGDFVVMTPTLRKRLATNIDTYSDPFPTSGGTQTAALITEVTVQVDVHGPNSADNIQIITTMFRDQYAVDALSASGFAVAPLYAGDARQTPFMNSEQQYEFRWTVDLALQTTPVVTVQQDFADAVNVTLAPVEVVAPIV